jgi:hypothetical protein
MPSSRTPEELSIINAIQTFASGIQNNDADLLRSSVVSSGSVTRTGIDPSRHIHISLSQLVRYISEAASAGGVEGRFNPDEATVKVDRELGMLWTKWTSFKDGKLTHKGSMIFTLVKGKGDGKWVIVSNADNLVAV